DLGAEDDGPRPHALHPGGEQAREQLPPQAHLRPGGRLQLPGQCAPRSRHGQR
ncbi:unnamed protein product, partial [Heterosigma akashiwo]